MAIIPNDYDFHRDTVDKWNIEKDEHRDAPKAKAVISVDGTGAPWSDLNPMPVKADLEVSDIQIGAVEIKDATTNQRAIVDANGRLLVSAETIVLTNPFDKFGTSMVAASASAVIVTHTVPVSEEFNFTGATLTGDEYGYFEFQINGITRASWRTSGSSRSAAISFPSPFKAVAGDVVDIKVTNEGNKTRSFDATIFGTVQ
jgi:hypothetical protein